MEKELLEVKGRIFNIQRFSIHDGPGIRTIIFLKGCPLRCRWCCNPEGQIWESEKITVGGASKIAGRDISVREVIEEIERDRVYYNRSGGGVTLSGGECLAQPEFAEAILRCAKNAGISTAIETTGYADFSVIERLLPHVDTVLMDIKHINGEKHKEFTTKDNSLILENAKKISRCAKRLIIRTPVVPTFNAAEEDIREIARFAKTLNGVDEIHLLPYHRIGSDKYEGLGRHYTMEHITPPERELMERLLDVVKSEGLKGQIGG